MCIWWVVRTRDGNRQARLAQFPRVRIRLHLAVEGCIGRARRVYAIWGACAQAPIGSSEKTSSQPLTLLAKERFVKGEKSLSTTQTFQSPTSGAPSLLISAYLRDYGYAA